MSKRPSRRAWIEVDSDALRRNYRRLERSLAARTGMLPMVKADGYGLGAIRAARALSSLEPWGLGVATVEEAIELRGDEYTGRVVVFFPCPPVDAADIARHGFQAAVSGIDGLAAFGHAALAAGTKELALHLEVDTGMGRLGLEAARAEEWIPELRRRLEAFPVRLAGTFTHFHSAAGDAETTREQWRRFEEVVERMRSAGLDPGRLHAANSSAILRHPRPVADLARPGIFLYGGEDVPRPRARRGEEADPPGRHGAEFRPEPVAALRARVLDVRRVRAGATVGYRATWRAEEPARLATLGIGYGDGLRGELSNRGAALIGGRRAPIRGSVCMDVTVVDVSRLPEVRPGEVATLLGRDTGAEIPLREIADLCDTTDYEVLTGLGDRLPRVASGSAGPRDGVATRPNGTATTETRETGSGVREEAELDGA